MTPEPVSKPLIELPESSPSTVEFAGLKRQYARLKPTVDAAIQRVLDHGQFIMGPEIRELESALAAFVGCPHAIAVGSGTDALLTALMAEDIGRGDAVFVPAFTFTASAEVIALLGATPVFVDVDSRSFNIDPVDLERRIADVRSAGALTPRAIMAVDLFGQPADYPALAEIAAAERLFLLADAAQSLGAEKGGVPVGRHTPVTATSFFPAKPLGCYGDGGALFTDDEDRAERLRSIRLHGKGGAKYDIARVGLNARLDTLQAAVLLAKLPDFRAELTARRILAEKYHNRLGNVVWIPQQAGDSSSSWAQYTILVDDRDSVAARLKDLGIPTAVYYPRPMHLQPAFSTFGAGDGSVPVSEDLCRRVLSLPMHPYMTDEESDRVCDAVIDTVKT